MTTTIPDAFNNFNNAFDDYLDHRDGLLQVKYIASRTELLIAGFGLAMAGGAVGALLMAVALRWPRG